MLLVAMAVGAIVTAVVAVLRPSLPTSLPGAVIWVAAAAGAVAVGLAETAPTGSDPLDLVLRVGFGAVVALAASRAGTVATVWLAAIGTAVLFVTEAPGAAFGAVSAGALFALAAAGSSSPPAQAIAAAAIVGPLAHADWLVATGASAASVAIAVTPLLLIGLARTGPPARGRILLGVTAVGLLLVAGAVAGLLAALSARSDVDRAVDLGTDGIDLLGDDDERARQLLRDAAGAFESAEDTLTTWWGRSALLVPGVAQQARAVVTMASAGAELARTAADASEDADVDSIRPVDGRVDLAALEALAEPLDRSLTSLRRAEGRLADVESSLLLSPIADRLDDLRTEIDDALGSAELATQAVEVAPNLLGADGPRRYFLAFQNPAELRGNGGFMGNWAELVADDGQLSLTRNGRSRDLFTVAPPVGTNPIDGEEEVFAVWGPQAAAWTSINLTPDHPTMGRLVSQLYPQSGGAPIDGVIAITPVALSGFLELTGPIDAPGYPEQLTSENAARILLHEQYLEFPGSGGEEREGFLGDVVQTLFDRLTTGELPGPRAIASELGPAVEGRHLQLWSSDQEEQALFRRLGATGEAQRQAYDSYGAVTQNLGANKIDWFLHRTVSHDVAWNPGTGQVEGTIAATLRNDAPAAGLPPSVISFGNDLAVAAPTQDGENRLLLTIYSGLPIEDVTVDGQPATFERLHELGHETVRLQITVPSQSVRKVVASIRGVVTPAVGYRTRPVVQASANPDELSSSVRVAGGWEVVEVIGGEVGSGNARALTRSDALDPPELTVRVEPRESQLTWLDRLRGTG